MNAFSFISLVFWNLQPQVLQEQTHFHTIVTCDSWSNLVLFSHHFIVATGDAFWHTKLGYTAQNIYTFPKGRLQSYNLVHTCEGSLQPYQDIHPFVECKRGKSSMHFSFFQHVNNTSLVWKQKKHLSAHLYSTPVFIVIPLTLICEHIECQEMHYGAKHMHKWHIVLTKSKIWSSWWQCICNAPNLLGIFPSLIPHPVP
jgi:hypothetical protein